MKKTPSSEGFLGDLFKRLKWIKKILALHKLFQRTEEEGYPFSFFETSTPLIPKPSKDKTGKLQVKLLKNKDVKILKKKNLINLF